MDRWKDNWKERFLKALKEDEVFAAEVRVLLLSADMLTLPQRMTKMEDRMTKMEKDVEILKQDVAEIKKDVGVLKGSDRERWYRDKGYSIFGLLLKKGRPYDGQVADLLWQALEKGVILEKERKEALGADLYWYGERENKWVVLVIEVSFTINNDDVQRAKRRAEVLRKAGVPAIPVAAGAEVGEGLELDEITCIVDGKISEQEFEKLFEKFSQTK